MSENVLDAEAPLLPVSNGSNGQSDRSSKPRDRLTAWLHDPGTAPLLVAGLIIGCACGLVAYIYDNILNAFIHLTWNAVPQHIVLPLWQHAQAWSWFPADAWVLGLYIVIICTIYGVCVGASQKLLGCPGDLPETIGSFHDKGYVPYAQVCTTPALTLHIPAYRYLPVQQPLTNLSDIAPKMLGKRSATSKDMQAPSMFTCSLFSVCAGGSLGPEAPLLCLCASTVSYLFQKLLPVSPRMLRYCSLMGMAAGLAAFFGVTMGGVLFALEVPHRMGLEYFEVAAHALASGAICLSVFRAFGLLPFGEIWQWVDQLHVVDSRHVLIGVVVGALAALTAIAWTYATKTAKRGLAKIGLDEHKAPAACGSLGGLVLGITGALLPPVMFWGEFELRSYADSAVPLPHIWPKGGVWGLAPFLQGDWGPGIYALVGVTKLFCISVTLLAGFRGGFIFPLFSTGAALGTALRMVIGSWLRHTTFPTVLFAMTYAAGLNTSITRTPLGTTLILTTLCGQPGVAVPCLAAALVALFATKSVPFMMTQRSRSDVPTMLSCSSKEPGDAEKNGHAPHVASALEVPIHMTD